MHKIKILICILVFTAMVFTSGHAHASWTIESPLPTGNDLYALWGASSSDVFAAGDGGTMIHFNGTVWENLTGFPAWLTIRDMWGTSDQDMDIYAVADWGYVLHYNGQEWSEFAELSVKTTWAIWGTSPADIYVLADDFSESPADDCCVISVIYHYDGIEWSKAYRELNVQLYNLWGTSDSDIFAVGSYYDGAYHGIVLHYDGSTWSSVTIGTNISLWGVWGSSGSDVYAVGRNGTMFHYNGSAWSPVETGVNTDFYVVWGTSKNSVFAVGDGGTILHYDGSSWTKTAMKNNMLFALWGSADNDIFAAGSGGYLIHYDGAEWADLSLGITANLNAAWGTSKSDMFAVGHYGTILQNAGKAWKEMNSGVTSHLNAVWGLSNKNVYAAGHDGKILHYDGTGWSHMTTGASANFYGLWGSSGSDIFAVGTWEDCSDSPYCYPSIGIPVIFHFDGFQWSPMALQYKGDDYAARKYWGTFLKDIWGTSWDNVYAVGYNVAEECFIIYIRGVPELHCMDIPDGVIFHYNGSNWSSVSTGLEAVKGKGLQAVWGSSSSDVFTVGDYGSILHYDGRGWSSMSSGPTQSLYGVWGSSSKDVFAVGYNGYILHYNGSTWSPITSPVNVTLNSLFGVPSDSGVDVFAAGNKGTILHFSSDDIDNDNVLDEFDECPESKLETSVIIGDCDTGVQNRLLQNGCSVNELVAECNANTDSRFGFLRCVNQYLRELKPPEMRLREKWAILKCAFKAK